MTTTPNSTTFYVYALARPVKKDWRIFYIGKGTKRRVFCHELEARRGHKCHKCNIIRKVIREGEEIQRYILLTTKDEQEAFDYEREMIALHGRGNLTNQTDGGEGASGAIASEKTRIKLSAAQKQRYTDPQERDKTGAIIKQYWADHPDIARRPKSQQHRERLLAASKSPSARAKKSSLMRQRYTDPAEREKTKAAVKAVRSTPESRQKTSQFSKTLWEDPERLAGAIVKRKETWARNGTYARMSATQKQRYSDPTERTKTGESIRQYYKDHPEARIKQSERMKIIRAARRQKDTTDDLDR